MIIFCNSCQEKTVEGYFSNHETLICLCRKCANEVMDNGLRR